MRTLLSSALLLSLSLAPARPAAAQQPAVHDLPMVPANIHWGYFDAKAPPALRIRPGDRVRVETMVARGLERPRLAGMTDADFDPREVALEAAVTQRGPGPHPMTGPIWIEGAEPGDLLEVRIEEIRFLSDWGVSGFLPGGGTIPDRFPYGAIRIFQLDTVARVGRMAGLPHPIPLAPFFGTIGVAPPVLSGRVSTTAPGAFTGNLDNADLVQGTTLFVPVLVEGALLSIGDAHAAQGHGEVSGTAVEASMKGTVQVLLHKGRGRSWPRAESPTHYLSMGLHPDLDRAMEIAVSEMVDFLADEKGMDRDDAYVLCSAACDFIVTQTVDQTKGIHGRLLKSIVP